MGKIVHNIKVSLDEDLSDALKWMEPSYTQFRILRKSLDARRAHDPHFIYSVELFQEGESTRREPIHLDRVRRQAQPVNIIGSGPAGLFAALRLVERGIPCRLFEQGSRCEDRLKAINRFWRKGELDLRNNVGFGEGGAGLYSDGKLITRIKSPHIPYVMQKLVQFGAPAEIEYLANPHVGSDKIRRVIPILRNYLLQNGCEIHFQTKVTRLLYSGTSVIGIETEAQKQFFSERNFLACGHSADDMFMHLAESGVFMEGKSFAVGLRIEHPQDEINRLQYRKFADHPKLEAANYKLAFTDPQTQKGVYSFCMCPGGYVLSSATSENSVVSNGMSNYRRNSPFANSAIVVSIDYKKTFGADLFAGLNYRNSLEFEAFKLVQAQGGRSELPVQRLEDFLNSKGRESASKSCHDLPSSAPSGVVSTNLTNLFDSEFHRHFAKGLEKFESAMRGFISNKAVLHGVESRTSCPLRVTRNPETLQSISHHGLYPVGEGAGYAGGITSAACDGIASAERVYHELSGLMAIQPE